MALGAAEMEPMLLMAVLLQRLEPEVGEVEVMDMEIVRGTVMQEVQECVLCGGAINFEFKEVWQ